MAFTDSESGIQTGDRWDGLFLAPELDNSEVQLGLPWGVPSRGPLPGGPRTALGASQQGWAGEPCPGRWRQKPAQGFRQRQRGSVALVIGESLRPALIPGEGNQMPLLDEEVTRSHCRMGSPVSGLWKVLSASVDNRH